MPADVGNALEQASSLTDVLAAYAAEGFAGSFTAHDSGLLECHDCLAIVAARDTPMSSLRRLEGQSDPDDMIAVVAITCPGCSTGGTLIIGFGPTASAEESDVFQALRDERHLGSAPSNSAPGETFGDTPTLNT